MSDWIVAGFEHELKRLIQWCICLGAAIVGIIWGLVKLASHIHIFWK